MSPKNITLGDDVWLGSGIELHGEGGITIGNGVIFAPEVTLYTRTHNFKGDDLRALPFDNRVLLLPIFIGDYTWIGRNVLILPGVKIGKYAVVGAGSVISKDVPDYGIAVGNPAKVIAYRDKVVIDKLIKEGNPFVYTKLSHEKEFIYSE